MAYISLARAGLTVTICPWKKLSSFDAMKFAHLMDFVTEHWWFIKNFKRMLYPLKLQWGNILENKFGSISYDYLMWIMKVIPSSLGGNNLLFVFVLLLRLIKLNGKLFQMSVSIYRVRMVNCMLHARETHLRWIQGLD